MCKYLDALLTDDTYQVFQSAFLGIIFFYYQHGSMVELILAFIYKSSPSGQADWARILIKSRELDDCERARSASGRIGSEREGRAVGDGDEAAVDRFIQPIYFVSYVHG